MTSIFDFTRYTLEEVFELVKIVSGTIYETEFERESFVKTVMAYIVGHKRLKKAQTLEDATDFILMCPWITPETDEKLFVYGTEEAYYVADPAHCEVKDDEIERLLRFLIPVMKKEDYDPKLLDITQFDSFTKPIGKTVVASRDIELLNGEIKRHVCEKRTFSPKGFVISNEFTKDAIWTSTFRGDTWKAFLSNSIDINKLFMDWYGAYAFRKLKYVPYTEAGVMKLYEVCYNLKVHKTFLPLYLHKYEMEKRLIAHSLVNPDINQWITMYIEKQLPIRFKEREADQALRSESEHSINEIRHYETRIQSLLSSIIGERRFTELDRRAKREFVDVLSLISNAQQKEIIALINKERVGEREQHINACTHYDFLRQVEGDSFTRGQRALRDLKQMIVAIDDSELDEELPLMIICSECTMPIECIHKLYEWEEKYEGKRNTKLRELTIERGTFDLCRFCSAVLGTNDKKMVVSGDPMEGSLTGIGEDSVLETLREDAFELLQKVNLRPMIFITDFIGSIRSISKRTKSLLYKKYASLVEFQRRNYLKLANRCLVAAKLIHIINTEKKLHVEFSGVKESGDAYLDAARLVLDVDFVNNILSLGLSEFDTIDKIIRKVPDMIKSFNAAIVADETTHHWILRRMEHRPPAEGISNFLKAVIIAHRDLGVQLTISDDGVIDLSALNAAPQAPAGKTFTERQKEALAPSFVTTPPTVEVRLAVIEKFKSDFLCTSCRRFDSVNNHDIVYFVPSIPIGVDPDDVIFTLCSNICASTKTVDRPEFITELCALLAKNSTVSTFGDAIGKKPALLTSVLETYVSLRESNPELAKVEASTHPLNKKGEAQIVLAKLVDTLLEFSNVVRKEMTKLLELLGETIDIDSRILHFKSLIISFRRYLLILSTTERRQLTEDGFIRKYLAKMEVLKKPLKFEIAKSASLDVYSTEATPTDKLNSIKSRFFSFLNDACVSDAAAEFIIMFVADAFTHEEECNLTEERAKEHNTFIEDRRQKKMKAYLASDFYEKLESGVAYLIGQEQEEYFQEML